MLIGCARVSTQDQNPELQRDALTKAGCEKIFEDKVGGTRAERPGLAKALEMLRADHQLCGRFGHLLQRKGRRKGVECNAAHDDQTEIDGERRKDPNLPFTGRRI